MNFKSWWKKIKPAGIMFLIFVLVIPVILFFLVDQWEWTLNKIPDTDWLSFWGSYLGAILSAIVAILTLGWYIVQYLDSEKSRRKSEAEQKIYEMLSACKPLLKVTPYIVRDEIDTSDYALFEMDKYVFSTKEDISAALKSKDVRQIDVLIKNVGNGPICYLEILNYINKQHEYCIGGPRDRNIGNEIVNAPSLVGRYSLDLYPGEEELVRIKFHISENLKGNILLSLGAISLRFVFKDILDNELYRDASTIFLRKIMCEKQEYADETIQNFFENRITQAINVLQEDNEHSRYKVSGTRNSR